MPERKSCRYYLDVSENHAQSLEIEALLQNTTVPEMLRLGVAYTALLGSIKSGIRSHFPDGTDVHFQVVVAAYADGIVKEFILQPDEVTRVFEPVLTDTYPELH